MKQYRLLISAALCSMIVLLSGCESEAEKYVRGELPDNAQVFFSNTLPATIDVTKDASSVQIEVSRAKVEAAATVNISSVGGDGLYTIPSSVTFAAGAATTQLIISYDPEQIAYDDYKEITLTVAADGSTPYANSSYTFRLGIPSPWKSLGEGLYREDVIGPLYELDVVDLKVEIQENELTPGLFRLVNPYAKYPLGVKDTSRDYYLEINATNPNEVYITHQALGITLDNSDGPLGIYSFAAYTADNGKTPTADMWGMYANGIITFPANQVLASLGTSLYYGNTNGKFMIAMPGIEVKDYSAELTYKGRFVDIAGNNYAIIADTLGADVASAKIAIARRGNEQAVLNGIIDGSVESVAVNADGMVQVPCDMSGAMTAIIVTYAENKAQEYATVSFDFSTGNPLGDLQEGKSIDDYVGKWSVSTSDAGQVQATVTKIDDAVVSVTGLLPLPGYDDTFYMEVDQATGWLSFGFQQMKTYSGLPVYATMLNDAENKLDAGGKESLIGGLLSDGSLLFVNNPANTGQWNMIGFFAQEKDWSLVNAVELNWIPITSSAPEATHFVPSFSGPHYKAALPIKSNRSLKVGTVIDSTAGKKAIAVLDNAAAGNLSFPGR
ncbi:MAG: hypothetical protein LBM06_04015 [Prevotellaceae bacterium]|jgi:hypothetical protein|nr:hypothetical protein [Prevotellaceae bacterium]